MKTSSSKAALDARVNQRAETLAVDTSFDWIRPIGRRRVLVVSQGIIVAALVTNAFAATGMVASFVQLALLVVGFVGVILLRAAMRGIADFPDTAVDERIISSRNAAYLEAYRWLAAGTALVMLIAFAASIRGRALTTNNIPTLMLSFLLAAISLPSAVLAWNQPDA